MLTEQKMKKSAKNEVLVPFGKEKTRKL